MSWWKYWIKLDALLDEFGKFVWPYCTTIDTEMKYELKCKFHKIDDLKYEFGMLVELNDRLDKFNGLMDELYKFDSSVGLVIERTNSISWLT